MNASMRRSRLYVALGIGLGVALIAATLAVVWQMRLFALRDAEQDLRSQAELVAGQSRRTVQAADLVAVGLQEWVFSQDGAGVQTPQPQAVERLYRVMQVRAQVVPEIRNLLVLDAQGRTAVAIRQGGDASTNPAVLSLLSRHLARHRDGIGQMLAESRHNTGLYITRPLFNQSSDFVGIAAVEIDPQALRGSGIGSNDLRLELIGRDGAVWFAYPPDRSAPVVPANQIERIFTDTSPLLIYGEGGGEDMISAVLAVPEIGAIFRLSRPLEGVLADWRRWTVFISAGALIICAILVLQIGGVFQEMGASLASARARYKLLADNASDMLSLHDPVSDLTVRYASPAILRLIGRTADEVNGDSPLSWLTEDDSKAARQDIERFLGSGGDTVLTYRLRHTDGHWVWLETAMRLIRNTEAGQAGEVVAITRDISERRRWEAALRDSSEQLRGILDSMVDGVIIIDSHGIIQDFNPAAEKLFGYSAEEMRGRSVNMLMPSSDASQHDRHMANYLKTGRAKIIGIGRELVARRKDGSNVPIDLAVSELACAKQDGRNHLFVGVVRDISERKRIEADLLVAKSRAEQANMAKSQFLANMSHELRTPLNAIIGFADLLQLQASTSTAPQSADSLDYPGLIRSSGQRLLEIINDILDMARLESGNYRMQVDPVELHVFVEKCLRGLRDDAAQRGVTLVNDIHSPELLLLADPRALRQVMNGFLSNAVKFTPDGGRVTVSTHTSDRGALGITVSDTGIGIAPEKLALLCQPFQMADMSLSRDHEGLGLGLAIARNLVEMHGGTVEITSRPGKGTSVTAWFPGERVIPG